MSERILVVEFWKRVDFLGVCVGDGLDDSMLVALVRKETSR